MRAWPVHRSRRAKWLIFGILAVVALFIAASVRLFLLPARDSPRHVDAIFVLGGSARRLPEGIKLAREGYAPNLVVSTPGQGCPRAIPKVTIRCFDPDPSTTQGEAREIAKLSKQYQWKSIIVISTTEQTTRARLRIKRCTDIDVAYVSVPELVGRVPYSIVYEWAALGKALIFQRGC